MIRPAWMPYKLDRTYISTDPPPGGIDQGNKDMASDWRTIHDIGHHAGYDKAELAHNLEVIRLKGRIALWKAIAVIALTGWAAGAIVAVSLMLKGAT